MIKEIEYFPEAVNDLHGIEEYISIELDNSESAERIVDNIIDKIDSLSDLPEIGVPLSSRVDVKLIIVILCAVIIMCFIASNTIQ